MQMIPSVIKPGPASNESRAERRVFETMSSINIGQHAICMHSLNLPQHEYKLLAELDFVIVCSRGILVLEVKGGGVNCDSNNVWTTEGRHGISRLSESPFQQAQSGMYALKRRLDERSHSDFLRGVPYGFGVIFPDVSFTIDSTLEWDEEILLDRRGFQRDGGLRTYLEDLYEYWIGKHKDRDYHWGRSDQTSAGQQEDRSNQSPLDLTAIRAIQDMARPTFELVPNLNSDSDSLYAKQEEATRDQYAFIDIFNSNERVLCNGGAGSGKTFLALETAVRASIQGQQVLMVCRNPALASFLRLKAKDSQIQIKSIDDLSPSEKYDLLVVDEGQDLMTIEDLDHLDTSLDGGLENGNWAIFYDHLNQSGVYDNYDPDAFSILESARPFKVPLTRNLRNTHPIVIQTKLLTGADIGAASAGPGPAVIGPKFYQGRGEASKIITEQLHEWLDNEIPPGDITILSPVTWENSAAKSISLDGNPIRILTGDFGSDFPCPEITFCDIASFKGLENRFIALIDFDDPDSLGTANSLLYVGMTRARAGLWISANVTMKNHLEEMTVANFPLIQGERERPYD